MISLEDKIEILKGDITDTGAEAIVNAANTELVLGSGVSGAIREKGGVSIQLECDERGPVPLGEAAVTGAGDLKARFIIHAAGMHRGGGVDRESLQSSTRSALLRAEENGVETVAFPAIGTGAGGFPARQCAEIMIRITCDYLRNEQTSLKKIYFVLFDDDVFKLFEDALRKKLIAENQGTGRDRAI